LDRHASKHEVSEKRHAGIRHGGVVLVGDAAVVAENLPFFGLDQPEQGVDGGEPGDAALVLFFLNIGGKVIGLEFFHWFEHLQVVLHRTVK
jgi:hypothetical protein